MVYASVPPYLDPPNWNQPQQQQPPPPPTVSQQVLQGLQAGGISGVGVSTVGEVITGLQQLPQAVSSVPPRPEANMAGGGVRPTSMAERARQAKVPQPEPALKCPRCESTNTKFCYFNNYSLSQPRHFCKTCRRYWTRGGALRNVPVGGGCRRNKRSKSSASSKTPATERHPPGTSTAVAVSAGGGANMIPSISPQLPFMGSFHSTLPDYGTPNVGMSYGTVQAVDPAQLQAGSSSAGVGGGLEQWRLQQQFPFFIGVEQPSPTVPPSSLGLYDQFEGASFVQEAKPSTASGLVTQLASSSVKMEESSRDQLSMPRQYLGMNPSVGDQYWNNPAASGSGNLGGTNWTVDLSGTFNSSSTGNLL